MPDVSEIPAVKERFLQLHGVIDLRDFMSGWFHGAPFEVVLLFLQQSSQQVNQMSDSAYSCTVSSTSWTSCLPGTTARHLRCVSCVLRLSHTSERLFL